MVAARKRENQNRINYKIYLFFYGKKTLQYLETHFVDIVPWNYVQLLFKCSPKIPIMSVRLSDKHAIAIIVHTISIVKKIAKYGQSVILMPFCVKKQTSTLAAYGFARYNLIRIIISKYSGD